jgi:predicted ATPase
MLRTAIAAEGGRLFMTADGSAGAAFATTTAAVRATVAAHRALHAADWTPLAGPPVRLALHSGAVEVRDDDYTGPVLERLAHLLAVGQGGQILLSQAVTTVLATTPPAGVFLRDLGWHRLPDLGSPERVTQVIVPGLPADFPPLRSLDAFRHNLPLQLTSFVGRAEEMARIQQHLDEAAGPRRLLTLIGPGGTGKTRLALQAAAGQLARFADGVWFVELAPLADPALLPQTVAAVVGVREEPARPLSATLVAALQSRQVLLVVDNCEHLIAAAADLVETLLAGCPRLVILASSREALGITGETVFRVPSLAQPTPASGSPGAPSASDSAGVGDYAAVRLFLDRARVVQPDLLLTARTAAALATICRRLDGIPLALELAAAQVRVLSVEQIAARLDDRFRLLTGGSRTALPRQQTLSALIDWSWDLLTADEQRLLRRLAVFVGGWTLAAAEATCADATLPSTAISDVLTQLVNKSMVVLEEQETGVRYRFLETIRQYAREKLFAAGEAAAFHDRHRDWFVDWVERTAPRIQRSQDTTGLVPVDGELDNLRAALAWAGETGADAALARLAVALGWFWEMRGYLSEGTQWTQRALDAPDLPVPLREQVLFTAGRLAFRRSDPAQSMPVLTEALARFRALGDPLWTAHTLLVLGSVYGHQGNPDPADDLFAEALALFRALGDQPGQARALNHLGERQRFQGHHAAAVELYRESLELAQGLGDRLGVAITSVNLAHIATQQGAFEQAACYYAEGLRLVQALGYQLMGAEALEGRATLAGVAGAPLQAARLFGAAEALRAAIGTPLTPAERGIYDPAVAQARDRVDPAAWAAAWAAGAALSWEQAIAEARQDLAAD